MSTRNREVVGTVPLAQEVGDADRPVEDLSNIDPEIASLGTEALHIATDMLRKSGSLPGIVLLYQGSGRMLPRALVCLKYSDDARPGGPEHESMMKELRAVALATSADRLAVVSEVWMYTTTDRTEEAQRVLREVAEGRMRVSELPGSTEALTVLCYDRQRNWYSVAYRMTGAPGDAERGIGEVADRARCGDASAMGGSIQSWMLDVLPTRLGVVGEETQEMARALIAARYRDAGLIALGGPSDAMQHKGEMPEQVLITQEDDPALCFLRGEKKPLN